MVFGIGGQRRPRPFELEDRETEEQRILRETGALMKAERIKTRKSELKARQAKLRGFSKSIDVTGERIGEQVAGFVGTGLRQRPAFSQEQAALHSLFGGGDKMWGLPDSETGVNINHDLNPRQRGDFGTARLFGF